MRHDRRFQVAILPGREWGAVLGRFQHVEKLGFDIAVTADQFVDWKSPSTPWFDVWTLLAGVAQATDTIRLAPSVAQISLRDPATLSRQVLTVAAMGPKMMRSAAIHADTWTTMSFESEFEAQLLDAAALAERMADTCAAVGRDPATLRYSYFMFDADARDSGGHIAYYEPTQRFVDVATEFLAHGFTELVLHYPFLESQIPVFEEIALEVIPRLRQSDSAAG